MKSMDGYLQCEYIAPEYVGKILMRNYQHIKHYPYLTPKSGAVVYRAFVAEAGATLCRERPVRGVAVLRVD